MHFAALADSIPRFTPGISTAAKMAIMATKARTSKSVNALTNPGGRKRLFLCAIFALRCDSPDDFLAWCEDVLDRQGVI